MFRTREEMDAMEEGQILEVLADDPASESDIRSWAKRTGHELLSVEKVGDGFRFLIRRSA